MTSRVALLVPVFNNPSGLYSSLESVRESIPVDVYIVDDGSAYVADEIKAAAVYQSSGCLHFVYLDRNLGIEAALNVGLRAILERGYAFVARLDAGDRCVQNRLRIQEEFLDLHPEIALVGSWVEYIDEAGNLLFTLRPPVEHERIARHMYLANCFVHPAVMMRSAAVQRIGFYSTCYPALEDHEYFFRFVDRYRTHNIPKVLLRYQVSSGSLSTRKRRQQMKSKLKLLRSRFRFGFYPILGLARSYLSLAVPRGPMIRLKSLIWR